MLGQALKELTHCVLVMPFGVGDWSTLVQVTAWCLTAPSHYLNQCWLTHQQDLLVFIQRLCLPNCRRYQSPRCVSNLHIWITAKSSRGQWVKLSPGNYHNFIALLLLVHHHFIPIYSSGSLWWLLINSTGEKYKCSLGNKAWPEPTRTTRKPVFWDTPSHPMTTHTSGSHQIPSQNKTKLQILKNPNF